MAKRTKKESELSPAAIIAGMDAEMGAEKPLFSEFQRGALWAMRLLQKQLDARRSAIRLITFDDRRMSADEGGVLGSLSNVYGGIEISFESELTKQMSNAEKEFKP